MWNRGYEDKCPVCGHEYFTVGDTYTRGDFLYQENECNQCESTWTEKWAFVEVLDIEDNSDTSDIVEEVDTETLDTISAWHVPKEEWHT